MLRPRCKKNSRCFTKEHFMNYRETVSQVLLKPLDINNENKDGYILKCNKISFIQISKCNFQNYFRQ